MTFVNPYRALVVHREALDIFTETARELPACVRSWTPAQFNDTYAPGKRTANRILLHLLHVELVDSVRLRMAISTPGYSVQPFDPDAWMKAELLHNGVLVVAAWSALRAVNILVWAGLTPEEWDVPFAHPECGAMTLRDLAEIWAGHDLHHLAQLRAIGAKACARDTRSS
ncbi:MAG: DinB family protein [Vicinamibacterales bacterium]